MKRGKNHVFCFYRKFGRRYTELDTEIDIDIVVVKIGLYSDGILPKYI